MTDIESGKYILKQEQNSISLKDKKDTTGELWIRLNNHPIAFPALAGDYPQIDTNHDYINGKFFNDIANKENSNSEETEIDRFDKFYDMEFDTRKSILFLAYYPVNDTNSYYKRIFNDENVKDHKEIYKDYEHSAFIICQINQQRIVNSTPEYVSYLSLQLTSGENNSGIDGYVPTDEGKRFLEVNSIGYSFEGFYKNEQTTGLVFIKKKIFN